MNIYMFSVLFSILFLLFIIELVRKNKILEKYSLLWLFFGVVLLVISSTPFFIEKIAQILGVFYAPSVLFFFGLIYLLAYCIHITIAYSKQAQRITRLTQEIAILKENITGDKANEFFKNH